MARARNNPCAPSGRGVILNLRQLNRQHARMRQNAAMSGSLLPPPRDRLALIDFARRSVMQGGGGAQSAVESWIERSWRRCLAAGRRPEQRLGFDMVSAGARRRALEASQPLVHAARPVLDRLSRALASTRYFAILTDGQGIVIDAHGPIDHGDPHAELITRVGVDLSERSVGTTAIGAALAELQPVWLHRGEHFFDDTSVYSCAGAPLFGPNGRCVGMLDLTGINAAERPELKHLVIQSARSIENALTLSRFDKPSGLLLRLNWPGRALGDETDGMVCLDADGYVLGANQAARQMLPQLSHPADSRLHCSELFAMALEMLFDAARRQASPYAAALEVPLWTGLRLHALPLLMGQSNVPAPLRLPTPTAAPQPLKDIETALIRKAVDDARGNVLKAARALGVSRATVYRRLGAAIKRR